MVSQFVKPVGRVLPICSVSPQYLDRRDSVTRLRSVEFEYIFR
jgi:hypothetical protein